MARRSRRAFFHFGVGLLTAPSIMPYNWAMHKILSTDDAVNTCDCCGKTGLRFTFVVETEEGEILHYGSTCVTKHTGRTTAKALGEIAQRAADVKAAREAAYDATPEARALDMKQREAWKLNLLGREFKAYCEIERAAADARRAEIFAN